MTWQVLEEDYQWLLKKVERGITSLSDENLKLPRTSHTEVDVQVYISRILVSQGAYIGVSLPYDIFTILIEDCNITITENQGGYKFSWKGDLLEIEVRDDRRIIMIKTPHRIMYEALTEEQYREFMRNCESASIGFALRHCATSASSLLANLFDWGDSNEGYNYWNNIHTGLLKKEYP